MALSKLSKTHCRKGLSAFIVNQRRTKKVSGTVFACARAEVPVLGERWLDYYPGLPDITPLLMMISKGLATVSFGGGAKFSVSQPTPLA